MRYFLRTGLLALTIAALGIPAALRADVLTVVAAKSPIRVLSKEQVADLFLGKMNRLPDGLLAVPIDQAEGSLAFDEFYAKVAGKSPAQIKAYWSKIIFTGRGQPPKAVRNDSEVKKRLADNLYSVGYIDSTQLDDTVRVLY